MPKGADITTANGKARFNPVLWLVNRGQDLPSWLALDSTRVAVLTIGLARLRDALRRRAAPRQPLRRATTKARRRRTTKFARDFAQMTDGLPLVALADIAQLADRQGIGFRDVDDAVQCYKVGVTENPWKKDYLRERIADALPFIEERVRGQRPAVTKTIDILMRSVMGLTGAQARASGNRPRGVLFFAGPTGVGKTELAKTLTQLIFGDERAYIRFDMSEFAEEHTGARLLGAPPGYIGYDAGGELTNAVREKPFSVVLFDEIEKAHPRILDKFLQILEDGRLTDGRGETAYFSEAILVFTSNLGIYGRGRARPARAERVARRSARSRRVARAQRDPGLLQVPAVAAGDPEPHRRQHHRVRLHHAGDRRADLRRHAAQRRQPRARRAQGRPRRSTPAVREELRELCTEDLSNGGRGIGNQLESLFVNPLARAMFRFPLERPQVGDRDASSRADENRIMTVGLRE